MFGLTFCFVYDILAVTNRWKNVSCRSMGRLCGKRKAICSMTTFLKRSGAALLSLVLLCVLAIGAGAASSQTVGVKFWKERSDKESMANSGIDADRTATLTRQANGVSGAASQCNPGGKGIVYPPQYVSLQTGQD